MGACSGGDEEAIGPHKYRSCLLVGHEQRLGVQRSRMPAHQLNIRVTVQNVLILRATQFLDPPLYCSAKRDQSMMGDCGLTPLHLGEPCSCAVWVVRIKIFEGMYPTSTQVPPITPDSTMVTWAPDSVALIAAAKAAEPLTMIAICGLSPPVLCEGLWARAGPVPTWAR